MAGFSTTRRIEAPIDRVFAVFADFPNVAERVRGITRCEILTDGPIGEGTRFRETRVMFGKEASEEMEITRFGPPRSYTVECRSHGAHYESVFDFAPAPGAEADATDVTVRFDARAESFAAKLLSPLSFLMMKTTRKCLEEDLDDLQAHLESSAA